MCVPETSDLRTRRQVKRPRNNKRDNMKIDEMNIFRLRVLLEEWADWQKGYRVRIGYPGRSAGFCAGGYVSRTFDEMCEDSDRDISALVDAAINDLVPVQSAAIYRRYLGALFRSVRVPYETALIDAHIALMASLPKKGVAI